MNARARGFSLIEVMMAVAVVALVVAIAYPSYVQYVIRGSRAAAQTELQELAGMEEKIYLNSNGYSANLAAAYDGTATGGLGKTSGKTTDGRYTLAVVSAGQSYTITATPATGTSQATDGSFSIASDGTKACGSPAPSWCPNASW
jgi:type IV pilus assembly protein PilE